MYVLFFLDQGRPSWAPGGRGFGTDSERESVYDTGDEMLEAVIRNVAASPSRPRERKRARNRDRKSCMYMLNS